ncbi:MAG: dTDP-4-dehydrorhamnose reductase [Pseudomonadales bacterium]|nr:dTDP-4-dehydrorhamnose reductase [Pseudomonadales bacterium]
MKILVTGANGQVGTELCEQSKAYGFTVLATDYQELDITDQQAVEAFVAEHKPDIIINSAAYTAVDKAEEEAELANRINAVGPKILATAAAENKIPLLHISTDYVFSGDKESPYVETDAVSPQGVYGETKNRGEIYVRESLDQYITLRTAWVFGVVGNNFVKTMIRLASEHTELGVVADQKGCPTFAGDIAAALLTIANDYNEGKPIPWGTYHYCGAEPTTWHGFAQTIFEEATQQGVLKRRPTVNALTTAEYPTAATRPANSVMNCEGFIAAFPSIGVASWKVGLRKVVASLA